jgi:hypothetical protein
MTTAGLSQEAQRRFTVPFCRQQEVHCGARLVDRAIQILPGALDLHVSSIRQLPPTGRLRARNAFLQSWHIFEDPTIYNHMLGIAARSGLNTSRLLGPPSSRRWVLLWNIRERRHVAMDGCFGK